MRITSILLTTAMLFISCENPGDIQDASTVLYRGYTVQQERAPFVRTMNSLAKDAEETVTIDESSSDGTVYGSTEDTTVYAAEGGEALPKDTWVDNSDDEPVTVSLTSNLTLTYETLATVTVSDAVDMKYLDEDGNWVAFAGSGVIVCQSLATGSDGKATVVSTVRFAIGGDDVEPG